MREFPEINVAGQGDLYVRFNTSMGAIVLRMEETLVPRTVKNFVGLATGAIEWTDPKTNQPVANKPFYNGLTFHRVIPNFMIQGGCPLGVGRGNPGYKFEDEFVKSLRHDRAGTLSMANSGPNSNGSQFFITEGATPHLDGKHTVFGYVVSGIDVVHSIANAPTGESNRPRTPITISTVDVFRSQQPPA